MTISAVIIAKNEETMILDCLKSLLWCDEIVVIDDYSEDKTIEILRCAQNDDKKISKAFLRIKIFQRRLDNDFAEQRNFGMEKANGGWILFVDADERVTPELKEEILKQVQNDMGERNMVGYKIKRKNFYLENHEWPYIEKIEKLFKKENLQGWKGELHETPIVEGEIGELEGFLLHYTHRDLSSMLQKTIQWSKTEAELRFKSGHPKMTLWRFPRVMLTAFINSYLTQSGWKIGVVGLIESIFQAFSAFITYARLWEMQNTTALHSTVVKEKIL